MNITRCPSCLKSGFTEFCPPCRRQLFKGKRVSPVLPFSRPEYNQKRREHASRMSISGVQSKYSLKLIESRLELTDTNGEYILKPFVPGEFENMTDMPANEHVSMQIARQVLKINTAHCAIVYFGDDKTPAYLTKRFDILPDGTRLLQEDFAQISNTSQDTHGKNYKYDCSYEKIAILMKKYVSAYQIEIEKFFKVVVFNYLNHNGDAHLKNFSLHYSPTLNSYILTPAYDLLNTHLHIPNETAMALDLFDSDYQTKSFEVNGYYAFDDFYNFGIRIGINPIRIKRFLKEICGKKEELEQFIDNSFLSGIIKKRYKELIADRRQALGYSYLEII